MAELKSTLLKVLSALLVGILTIGSAGCMFNKNKNHKLLNEIRNKYTEEGKFTLSLSDITDFEWDSCIVYTAGTTSNDIRTAYGIEYDTVLDVNSGIVFIKDKKAVYEEFFDNYSGSSDDGSSGLVIWPFPSGSKDQKKNEIFEKEKAKFECTAHKEGKKLYFSMHPSE